LSISNATLNEAAEPSNMARPGDFATHAGHGRMFGSCEH
jgi:hypothetical protein